MKKYKYIKNIYIYIYICIYIYSYSFTYKNMFRYMAYIQS